MDFGGSRDVISGLPEVVICHILSFLTTKEAASTSVLSSEWRYRFAFVSSLDFDASDHLNHQRRENVSPSFMDFVDRVLALRGNSHVNKLSLKIKDGDAPVDPVRVFRWILNALERGVSDLNLRMELESESLLPSEVFLSETLVRLKLSFGYGPNIEVEDVYLPKLKALYLEGVHFEEHGIGLAKLLSGCHTLEDLVLDGISWFLWDFASVSVMTLKRLTFCWEERDENPKSVSLDTPNLVYLELTDTVADKYPKVNLDSLVEARICLRMSEEQMEKNRFLQEASVSDLEIHHSEAGEDDMVGNATDFIMGISNVETLSLSADTLEVLTYCCEAMPLFNNLTQLTIESSPKVGWQSLPGLLKNSPNLETLVLQGLVHKATDKCGDVCLCKREEEEEIPTCLSSSPVKVLKIMKFGEIYDDKIEKQVEQVEHFVEMMPNLEQLILYYGASFDEHVNEVSTQIQRFPRVASSECNVQLISDQLN